MLTLSIKHYEYASTEIQNPGMVQPPDGDDWFFVAMSGNPHSHTVILWAREKKKR